jgi:hypothetical protein
VIRSSLSASFASVTASLNIKISALARASLAWSSEFVGYSLEAVRVASTTLPRYSVNCKASIRGASWRSSSWMVTAR